MNIKAYHRKEIAFVLKCSKKQWSENKATIFNSHFCGTRILRKKVQNKQDRE
jgi:hypothetical protein